MLIEHLFALIFAPEDNAHVSAASRVGTSPKFPNRKVIFRLILIWLSSPIRMELRTTYYIGKCIWLINMPKADYSKTCADCRGLVTLKLVRSHRSDHLCSSGSCFNLAFCRDNSNNQVCSEMSRVGKRYRRDIGFELSAKFAETDLLTSCLYEMVGAETSTEKGTFLNEIQNAPKAELVS